MCKPRAISSLLFSSLLWILAAFGLVFCDNALSLTENTPLLDEEQGEGENDPLEGFWRITGIVDAPPDWIPSSNLLRIWFGATEPQWEFTEGCTFTLIFTSQTHRRWHFKTRGDYTCPIDPWNVYFFPPSNWWSHPDSGTPVFRRTWVQGYMWVEFGGGWALVLADEDWSFNPKNYADGWPRPDWKYYQPYPHPYRYYWVWDSVYLNLL